MDQISASSNLLGSASTGVGSNGGNTPSNIPSSSSFDAIVQNALNAGVAPQQVLQFLQANLQQMNQSSTNNTSVSLVNSGQQQTSINNPSVSVHSSNVANIHNLNAFQQQLVAQHQVAAALAAQQQQLQQQQQQLNTSQTQSSQNSVTPQTHHHHHNQSSQQQQISQNQSAAAAAAAVVQQQQLHQQQQMQQQIAAVAAAAAAAANSTTSLQQQQHNSNASISAFTGMTVPSLAWPIFQPTVSIPFFDMATYQKVNLDVQPSSLTNGMDLPLSDINTLRFFFNFGVQHARAILLRQHIQSQNGQTGQSQQQIALLQAAQNVNQQQQNDQLLMQQNLLKIHNESVLSSTSSSINLQKTTPICINAISSITSCAGGSLTNNTASNSISSSAAAALAAVLQQRDISGSGGTNISITAANNSSIAINALQNSITHQGNKSSIPSSIVQTSTSLQQNNQNTAFKPLSGTNNTTNSEHLDSWLQHLLASGSIASGNVSQLRAAAAALSAQQQQQFKAASSLTNGGNTSGLTPTSTAAVVQLLLHHQQQQQQYNAAAVAMAAAQNATESLPQKITNVDRDNIELIRPQAINPLTVNNNTLQVQQHQQHQINSTSTHLVSTPTSTFINILSSSNLNTPHQTSILSGNSGNISSVSVSPKPPIPIDPTPRKESGIPSALHTQLTELKQRGLMALRSPDPMNENLKKSLLIMAEAMNVSLPTGISALSWNDDTKSVTSTQPLSTTITTTISPTCQNDSPSKAGNNFVTPSLASQLSTSTAITGRFIPNCSTSNVSNTSITSTNLFTFFVNTASTTRSLTSGLSGHGWNTSASNANLSKDVNNSMPSIIQNVLPIELQETVKTQGVPSLLAATEVNYAETFKRNQSLSHITSFNSNNKKESSPHSVQQTLKSGNSTTPTPSAINSSPSSVSSSSSENQRRKSGVYMLNMDGKQEDALKKKTSHISALNNSTNEKIEPNNSQVIISEIQPAKMVNYVNNVLSSCKAQIYNQGLDVHFDENGQPIDFSSRPIDPIFRNARERRDNVRDFRTSTNQNTESSTDSESKETNQNLKNGLLTVPGLKIYRERSSSCLIGISNRLKNSFNHDQREFSPTNSRKLSSPLAAKYFSNSGALNKKRFNENANASPVNVATNSVETNNEVSSKLSHNLSPSIRQNIKTPPHNLILETNNESNDSVFVENSLLNTATTSQISRSTNSIEDKNTKKNTSDDLTNLEPDYKLVETVNTAPASQSTFSADDERDLSSPNPKRLRIASFSSGEESESN